MTRLPGVSFDSVQSTEQARSAGALVGRFHTALDDFTEPLAPMGLPFFDTAAYRARFRAALERHADHPARPAVEALVREIEAGFARLGPPPEVPSRVIHGDLKISNVLFEGAMPPENIHATALIDLDTLMRAPLYCEWGDAWRSWCAVIDDEPGQTAGAGLDLEIFRASVEGYREGLRRPVAEPERVTLVLATDRIALELALRFATDALEERYFAWDASRYESASAHQQVRARGQIALAAASWRSREARAAILDTVLA
jgi:Ser/Thr protein kinase RdoA (MazF antagonist)